MTRRWLGTSALVAAGALILLLGASGASAEQREHTHSFGRNGTSIDSFASEITAGAFDTTRKRFYTHLVPDGLIGWSVELPGTYVPLGPPWPIGPSPVSGTSSRGIVVDNRPGPLNGRIYRTDNQKIIAFNPDGSPADITFPAMTPFNPCGIALDSEGNIFVANTNPTANASGRGILRYTPTGTELPPIDTSGNPGTPCRLALDANDNLYVATSPNAQSQVWKYTEASGYTTSTLFDPFLTFEVATNLSTGHVFVAHPERVVEYSENGSVIREFGNEPGLSTTHRYLGVAVDETTDEVYLADSDTNAALRRVQVYSAPKAVSPEAFTLPPENVTRVSATLMAEVDPVGGAEITECVFEWGTTTAYGNTKPCHPAVSPESPIAGPATVTAELTGLTPQTVYHVRVRVKSADGTTVGPNRTITTMPAVLETTTGEATEVSESSAILHGSFNADGIPTSYYFEYATGTAACPCANKFPVPPGASGGDSTEVVEVSQKVTGLIPSTSPAGQIYTYRFAAVNEFGTTFGASRTFTTLPAVKSVTTLSATDVRKDSVKVHGTLDPAGSQTRYYFEYGNSVAYGSYAPVPPPGVDAGSDPGVQEVSAVLTGLETGVTYNFRLVAENEHGKTTGPNVTVVTNEEPELLSAVASDINTDGATLRALINPNALATQYQFEFGEEDCSLGGCEPTAPASIGNGKVPVTASRRFEGLAPGTTYHFRVKATNSRGTVVGEDQTFTTFAAPVGGDPCPNILERKQTGAGQAPHCRAYELVSAADTGGYDVESNLLPDSEALPGYPQASDAVLYTVRFGSIPGSGNPPNRGGDPYLATRASDGWVTRYVGLQADGTPTAGGFSSRLLEADSRLRTFAFGGPDTCSPCFPDGSVNIPLRLPDGQLVKGMAGSENPGPVNPAGEVRRHFSADGSHLVFGSTARLEPQGNNGSLSIYNRNLAAGKTEVVSTMPNGTTMPGTGLAALDISADGSRVLIGRETGTDSAGNKLHDLYMHLGAGKSVLVVDTPSGVLFAGMSSDGRSVYFTTKDPLTGDSDSGADLFRAEVGETGAVVSRVSTGPGGGDDDDCDPVPGADGNHWNEAGEAAPATCGVVAIAGGGGIAAEENVAYFLSPEQLVGTAGEAGEPNLYRWEEGSPLEFVATINPDNPLIGHAISNAARRDSSDFQVTSDGRFAAFATDLALTGSSNAGHVQIYRYAAGGGLICASCAPTNAAPSTDTTLTTNGLNLIDDGRVFYTSAEQLVLHDTNRAKDVYEWDEGEIGLVSTGLDQSDSGLLTASADGRDVFFFTRQTLAPQDGNHGAMKIYDAREFGGFLFDPLPPPCAAADECRGPGTATPPPPPIGTYEGTNEPYPVTTAPQPAQRCRKGFVRKRGKCVRKRRATGKRRKAGRKAKRKRGGQRALGRTVSARGSKQGGR